jgi:hypothetical protein
VPVIIDAGQSMPWADVVAVVDVCHAVKVPRIEFASAMPR